MPPLRNDDFVGVAFHEAVVAAVVSVVFSIKPRILLRFELEEVAWLLVEVLNVGKVVVDVL